MSLPNKKINPVLESTLVLAQLMKQEPKKVEQEILKLGEELVTVKHDSRYSQKIYKNLNQQKIEIIKSAIEDISSGVAVLQNSTLGLHYKKQLIIPFISPRGSKPDGDIIFQISWNKKGSPPEEEATQDEINIAIYALTYEISRLLL